MVIVAGIFEIDPDQREEAAPHLSVRDLAKGCQGPCRALDVTARDVLGHQVVGQVGPFPKVAREPHPALEVAGQLHPREPALGWLELRAERGVQNHRSMSVRQPSYFPVNGYASTSSAMCRATSSISRSARSPSAPSA